ncbi:MAG TPA: D-glucuronyl C5-epimerase family protein, partial [Gaiellaceae bacterium]|nr:D-glucuronyl C5-epimerase family protein [Gaiellaceae bacterium]
MTRVRGLVCVVVALAALLLAGAAPATSVTSAEKAALTKLKSAQKAGRIDAATAASARAEIARAAHLIRTLPNGRGYHVQVALDEAASFSAPLTEPRALELYGALKANDDFFSKHWAPADLTDIVGADGVVYRYFGGYDFRFHPLANFGVLNARIAAGDAAGTQQLADALITRGVYQKGGGIAWEYDFNFSGGRAPWLSGMAQAVAAQAFAAAAALVPARATAYMNEARAAERVIPKRLINNVSAGPWIRLYGFSSLVVFNAQLQSTLSLQSYATASGDSAAAALAKRMGNAAYAMLPRFDTGYWSYYSLPDEPSPVSYHQFVVSLLKKLAVNDPRFSAAAARFASYEKQPPAFQLANAGVGQVKFWLSKPATVRLDTAAGPAKSLSLNGGWQTLQWSPKQPGIYSVHVTATDWLGNKATFDALPIVRVAAAAKTTSAAVRAVRSAQSAVPGQSAFTVGAGLSDPSQAPLAQQLGLRLVRVGVAWPAAAAAPDPNLVAALAGVPAGLGELVELNTGTIPPDATTQGEVAQYAAALAQQVPALRYLVLAPAPTPGTAAAYATTLAAIRDAVHAVTPAVAVGPLIDGSLAPRTTVQTLGRSAVTGDVIAFKPAPTTTQTSWATPNISVLTSAFGALPPLVIDGVASPTADPAAYTAAITSNECSPNVAGVVFDQIADNATTETTTGLFDATGNRKPAATAVA